MKNDDGFVIYSTVDAMERYGGSFVKALAHAYYCADPINKRLLYSTFKHYFDEYEKYVEKGGF